MSREINKIIHKLKKEELSKHTICVFEVTEDIKVPDYIGGDSYEFCTEHNLFHVALKKGEQLYALLDEIPVRDDGWSFRLNAYSADKIASYAKDTSLMQKKVRKVLKDMAKTCIYAPFTDEAIVYRGIMDGNMNVEQFVNSVKPLEDIIRTDDFDYEQ